MDKDRPKKIFDLFSEGIFAALMPIFGYLIAYRYETGFAEEFDIPSSLVVVDLSKTLRVTGILIFLYILILGFLDIRIQVGKSENAIIRSIGRFLIPLFLLFGYIVLQGTSGLYVIPWGIIIALTLIVEFVLPLVRERKTKGYKKKLEKQEEGLYQRDNSFISRMIKGKEDDSGLFRYAFVVLILISIFYINLFGSSEAKQKTKFLVIKSSPELVVLREYSQIFICAEFDRKNRTVQNVFYLKSFDFIAEQGLKMELEILGQLRPTQKKK